MESGNQDLTFRTHLILAFPQWKQHLLSKPVLKTEIIFQRKNHYQCFLGWRKQGYPVYRPFTDLSVFCLRGGAGIEQNNKSLPPWNVESSETISGPSRHKVTSRAVGVLHSPVNMLQEDWTGFRNICKVFTGGWARGPASKQEQPLTSEAAHVQHPPAVHVRIQSKQFWSTIVCDRTGQVGVRGEEIQTTIGSSFPLSSVRA